MKKLFAAAIVLIAATFMLIQVSGIKDGKEETQKTETSIEINGTVEKGETFFEVFKRYGLDIAELFEIRKAAADVYRLRKVQPGQQYKLSVNAENRVNSLSYWIDDDNILNITRDEKGFTGERIPVEYEKRIEHIGGTIKDNLVSSMGEDRESLLLALQLSDIFAWDIDFTTDLRNEDEFRIVVEGLYLEGEFKKYGDILSAEFINNKETYNAYRFTNDGRSDYYDAQGRSLKKAFLKAPLSFRRISSSFSRGRFHPVLKIYRPHHGVDYAAQTGTPVSASGDGTVVFSGYKGQYGRLIIVKHNGGYSTYYGHLSRINTKIRKGSRIDQGQVIGYVGQTGLATGPHLHYEMRINNRAVNPLSVKIPHGKAVPKELMAEFIRSRDSMNTKLASISATMIVSEKVQQKPANNKDG